MFYNRSENRPLIYSAYVSKPLMFYNRSENRPLIYSRSENP